MRSLLRGLLLATAVAVWCLPAEAAGGQRTGPDSFFRWRADTVEEAMAQIENDAVLRQRLAKHFHVSQAQLVSYLRKNLVIVTMPTSGWRTVYGVNSSGRIYRARDYFRQGAKAFGLRNGQPLLKYACGNPLITELPLPRVTARVPPAPPLEVPQESPLVAAVPVVTTIELPLARPVTAPQEPVMALAPLVPAVVVPTATLTVQRAAPWLLASLPFMHDHGGTPIIPEPGSALLLGAGLAAWLTLRRRAPRQPQA